MNPKITKTVEKLQSWGFETYDSGNGETHDFDFDLEIPYVHIAVSIKDLEERCDTLLALLHEEGVDFDNCPHPQYNPKGCAVHPCIEASYLPLEGKAFIHLFNVVL
jgi:hypothetical protein